MRKILLAAAFLTTAFFGASAQSKFSLGPNVGFGHSWISDYGNTKFKPYGNFGASLVYSAMPHFGIGVDAKYSFEGAKTEFNNVQTTLNLDYIRIPVKAIYFFNKLGNKIRPKIFAGPSFGFLTSAKIGDISFKDNLKSFDLGLTGGVGFNLRLVANTWFNADLTYNNGLSEEKNRNIGLNVGVNFGL